MIGETSRYIRTTLYDRDYEVPMLAIRERFKFNTDLCSFYTWVLGDSLDRISTKYYGIPDFRWAILDANPTIRSEFEIEIGDHILIPDAEEILGIISEHTEDDDENEGYVDENDFYEDEEEE